MADIAVQGKWIVISSVFLTSLTLLFQEKRIYDLKKKNQELEKFKFVLDYKIKELKKQIEPRESDINNMKEQIQEVTTVNPLYNGIRYNSKICYNVNLVCTKISESCIFSLIFPCYSSGQHMFC